MRIGFLAVPPLPRFEGLSRDGNFVRNRVHHGRKFAATLQRLATTWATNAGLFMPASAATSSIHSINSGESGYATVRALSDAGRCSSK